MAIIITCGYPASGKTSHIKKYEKTHRRLNRDEIGGSLAGVALKLEQLVKKGEINFILDNTYASSESRAEVLRIGEKYGIPVECLWIATGIEDAQFNASQRMVRKYGKILGPEAIKKKKDPNCFPATVLFSFRKRFEIPTTKEGFSKVDKIKFIRTVGPGYKNKAIIMDYDGTLRVTKSGEHFPRTPDDVKIMPNRTKVLKKWAKKGYLLLGISNQSGIAKGQISLENAIAALKETNRLLGVDIDFRFCPHKVPPINCHCRKPQTGLGVELIENYTLDRSQCIFVGDLTTDKTFAKRCGFQFQWADKTSKGNKKNQPGFFDED